MGVTVHVVDTRRPSGAARWTRRIRLARSWARRAYPWRTVWLADPRMQKVIDELAHGDHFDVAVAEDNSMGVFRFPAHVPSVLIECEVRRARPIRWSFRDERNPLVWAIREDDWRRWPAYQRDVWSRFDRIQVFSDRDSARIAELAPELGERVRVNPFGIELPEPVDPALEEPGLVLFAGNYTHLPNVDAAVWLAREIMPRLRALSAGARLRLVGPAPPREVSALAGADVEVLGAVPSMAQHLEAAAVVVAPVRIGGGMRMKVLDALASQKAVVTTSRGAEGFLLPRDELPLVIADDAESIANATARLLNDQEWRRILAARARSFAAEHHSAEAYGRRMDALYQDVVADRRRPHAALQVNG
jgi:glycosyltransferase involved in cell wall biosynthesis